MKKSTLTIARNLFFLSALTLGLSSCEKDEQLPQSNISPETKGFFVSNEGGFMKNEATLSFVNLDADTVLADVYAANNGEQLGDIAQSLTSINGKLYIVVNNSKKVVAINQTTFKKEATITGLGSPNFIAEGGTGVAYITDLFGGPISVVNLSTHTVTSTINCPGQTNEMLTASGKTYVTNSSSKYLFVIDHSTNAINDSIEVGEGAQSIVMDAAGKVWIGFGVLYNPDYSVKENGKLKSLNLTTKSIEFNKTCATSGVKKVRLNKEKNTVFYINKSLYKMATSATDLPASAFYTNGTSSFYGLGVDVNSGNVYVSDAKDYTAKGSVYQVTSSGTAGKTFNVGIIPGDFYFLNK